MSSYSKFKKIPSDRIDSTAITRNKMSSGFGTLNTFIVASEIALKCDACAVGGPNIPWGGQNNICFDQAYGKCCLWTVPSGARRVTFELWSGGGGGAGQYCICMGGMIHGGGGGYAVKTISTTEGCQYTICAGGVWPCATSNCCNGGMGCASYVTGYNLDNFCVNGGCGGWVCRPGGAGGGEWNPGVGESCIGGCAPCACGFYGADFGIMGTSGSKIGHGATQNGQVCMRGDGIVTGIAPFTGKSGITSTVLYWCHYGCYIVWPGGGGFTGTTSYCGDGYYNCSVTGMMGGSGMVKVTYA